MVSKAEDCPVDLCKLLFPALETLYLKGPIVPLFLMAFSLMKFVQDFIINFGCELGENVDVTEAVKIFAPLMKSSGAY